MKNNLSKLMVKNSAEVIYDNFEADYLVVTNLFRDQLDRYGELATTKKFIQNGIDKGVNNKKNSTL